MTDHWHNVRVMQPVRAYRPGWRGVWDHVRLVWRGREPVLVPFNIEISAHIWGTANTVEVDIAAVQCELTPPRVSA